MTWQGGGERVKVRDTTFGFGGEYVGGPAIAFAVSDDGSSTVYPSHAAGRSNPDEAPPGVGRERNGIFFDHSA